MGPFRVACRDGDRPELRRDRFAAAELGEAGHYLSWPMLQWSVQAMRPATGNRRSVPRSGEAECLALLGPGERQSCLGNELLDGESAGLTALQERTCDVGGEEGKAQQQGHIGRA